MDIEISKLEPPSDFPFPFTPYSIQREFMTELYKVIEDKKLAVFESPTGTGKSMSMICGALKWLQDNDVRVKSDILAQITTLSEESTSIGDTGNWFEDHAVISKSKQKKNHLQAVLEGVKKSEAQVEEIKKKAEKLKLKENNLKRWKKDKELKTVKNSVKNVKESENEETDDDCDILLEDFSAGLVCDVDSDSEEDLEESNEDSGCKIIICSRTHSQISQLVHEIKKSPFSSDDIRVVTLSSRQNYCVNDSVVELKTLSLINERCEDLQKSKSKQTAQSDTGRCLKKQKTRGSCPFYQSTNIDNVRVRTLTEIMDIEDTAAVGREHQGCPYYSSRRAVPTAQVILMPYNTLLHRKTRQASNVNLNNAIVIVDEAHNLIDAILNIHSCTVRGGQLSSVLTHLTDYKDKYGARLTAYNLLYLNQMIFVVKRLIAELGGSKLKTQQQSRMLTLAEFICECEIDTVNLFKLIEFSEKSRLCQKLKGFSKRRSVVPNKVQPEKKDLSQLLKRIAQKSAKTPPAPIEVEELKVENIEETTSGSAVAPVMAFLDALTNHCGDSRVVVTIATTKWTDSSLKVTVLNPAEYFKEIVDRSRCVVLAGGTMEPMEEFIDLMKSCGASSPRIQTLSLSHVIPPSSILPLVVERGPGGQLMDFTYSSRSHTTLVDDLGRLLVNISNVVPGGIVCFFPSYDYQSFVHRALVSNGVWDKLKTKKTVLQEPKHASQVEATLREFSLGVAKSGAILFSVVGGKLSEGLNFSDDLGRCVIVVGMPYPNCKSVELQEKMRYLDLHSGHGAGQRYYENLCMKAVNQSIGRSIRHAADYASVLLLDHRYSRPHCTASLPRWIQTSLRVEPAFGPVVSLLAKFFASKRVN